jgi:hypothetical protein
MSDKVRVFEPGRGHVRDAHRDFDPEGRVVYDELRPRIRDGTWRPHHRFDRNQGLRMMLRRAHGITSNRVLKRPLRFQCAITGEFTRDRQHPWSTFDTVSDGQRSRPMGRQLLELPVSTLLLDPLAQHTTSHDVVTWPYKPDPQRTLAELYWIAGLRHGARATPVRLQIAQPAVWGHHFMVNMIATLERVSATQKDSIGAEYVDLTFREYRPLHADRKRRPHRWEKTRHHKLKDGDTLYELAKHYYHRASLWEALALRNGIKRVRPHSEHDLAHWAKHHHKKEIIIPPRSTLEPRQVGRDAGGA